MELEIDLLREACVTERDVRRRRDGSSVNISVD